MKIQKFCKWLVTILFLALIFSVGIGTVVNYPNKLVESVTRHAITDQYMGDDPTISERIQARFLSFENAVNTYLFGRDAGLTLNIAMQQAMGKEILQFGESRMVTLKSGHFYDLVDYTDVSEQLNNVIEAKNTLFADIPMIYVYAQSTLYDEEWLPEGVRMLDHNMELADEIIATLTDAGIEVIDTREVLNQSGYPLEELLLYSDQHWSSKAALVMAEHIAQNLQQKGLPVAAENLSMDKMESTTFEENFLGKYGQRIGPVNSRLDDMTAFYPTYETDIHRETRRGGDTILHAEGEFKDSVIRWELYENDPDCDYSTEAYKAYGLTEPEELYTNNLLPEGKILVVKDSFGASVNSFLSLTANQVWGIDLRHTERTLEEVVAELQPDAVVYVYSQQILRDFDVQ